MPNEKYTIVVLLNNYRILNIVYLLEDPEDLELPEEVPEDLEPPDDPLDIEDPLELDEPVDIEDPLELEELLGVDDPLELGLDVSLEVLGELEFLCGIVDVGRVVD